jgi:hypothetical protein
MILKKISQLFSWFKRRGIDWVLASAGPQQCVWAFSVTGGGTGTDAVTFASKSLGGVTCPDMADTTYFVAFGIQATGSGAYVSNATKTVAGFSILGLAGAETIDVMVIGRAANMPAELAS